jgi:type I restriction enzyme S subunit
MSRTNLPEGWMLSPIGDLCFLFNGRAFKTTEWKKNGLPIIRIQNLNNPKAEFNYFQGELDEKHLVKKGDLLFAWSGTPGTSFGTHEWKGGDAALNQHIFKIEFPEQRIFKSFLRYAIDQKLDELISAANGGVGLRHITKGTFESTAIAFPPLAEQKIIAEKLDSLLAQVESTKTRLERIPEIIKRFRQSVLSAAVSGRLTEPPQEATSVFQLKDICTKDRPITYGVIKLGDENHSGVPCLRTSNIRWLNIETSEIKRISKKISNEYSRTILRGNEVLVNVRGTLGGVSTVTASMIGWNVSREVAVVAIDPLKAVDKYVAYMIASNETQQWLKNAQKGVAYVGINLEDLRKLPIRVPSIHEQTEIVRRVEQLFAFADTIEKKANAALERVNKLTQSILAKAFRGELTAEWRAANPDLITGENSAAALLERIKKERETTTAKPNKRKAKA